MRGHHMQAVARVLQHLGHAPTVKGLQVAAEFAADLLGGGTLLPRRWLVALVDVVVLQPLQRGDRIVQTGRGHAPRADGRPHQMHRLMR